MATAAPAKRRPSATGRGRDELDWYSRATPLLPLLNAALPEGHPDRHPKIRRDATLAKRIVLQYSHLLPPAGKRRTRVAAPAPVRPQAQPAPCRKRPHDSAARQSPNKKVASPSHDLLRSSSSSSLSAIGSPIEDKIVDELIQLAKPVATTSKTVDELVQQAATSIEALLQQLQQEHDAAAAASTALPPVPDRTHFLAAGTLAPVVKPLSFAMRRHSSPKKKRTAATAAVPSQPQVQSSAPTQPKTTPAPTQSTKPAPPQHKPQSTLKYFGESLYECFLKGGRIAWKKAAKSMPPPPPLDVFLPAAAPVTEAAAQVEDRQQPAAAAADVVMLECAPPPVQPAALEEGKPAQSMFSDSNAAPPAQSVVDLLLSLVEPPPPPAVPVLETAISFETTAAAELLRSLAAAPVVADVPPPLADNLVLDVAATASATVAPQEVATVQIVEAPAAVVPLLDAAAVQTVDTPAAAVPLPGVVVPIFDPPAAAAEPPVAVVTIPPPDIAVVETPAAIQLQDVDVAMPVVAATHQQQTPSLVSNEEEVAAVAEADPPAEDQRAVFVPPPAAPAPDAAPELSVCQTPALAVHPDSVATNVDSPLLGVLAPDVAMSPLFDDAALAASVPVPPAPSLPECIAIQQALELPCFQPAAAATTDSSDDTDTIQARYGLAVEPLQNFDLGALWLYRPPAIRRGFKVIAPLFVGMGRYTMAELTEDVMEMLRAECDAVEQKLHQPQ
jgi:hypothetical protein